MADDTPAEPFSVTSNIIDRWKLRNPSVVTLLPDTFFPVIGRVAVAWGFFESAFEELLGALAAADGLSENDWRGLSFRRRRTLFRALLGKHLGDCPTVIALSTEIARDSEHIYPKRNLVVHGRLSMQFSNHDVQQIVQLLCVGRINRHETQIALTADQLDDLYYEIAHLHGRLHHLRCGDLGPSASSHETQKLRDHLAARFHPDPTHSTPQSPPGSSPA